MAVVGSVHGGSLSSKLQTLPPIQILNTQKSSINHHHNHRRRRPPTPPIFISTNLSHVNPIHLRDLYSSCNHSCHRFPNVFPDGRVEPVDVAKLRIAISHSSVVVSVFASLPENLDDGGDWYRKMIPVTPFSGQLVGFGRAVSDDGLTASIYDVMVIPSLRGRGIGRMILQRIIRLLTNKGVYDIAALCSDEEMDFFKACGFGDDILGSTTMMYSRSGNDHDMVKSAGDEVGIKLRIRDDGINLSSPIGNADNHLQTGYYSGVGGPNYPSSGNPGYRPPYTPSPAGPSYHHPRMPPPPTYPYAGGLNHQPPPPTYPYTGGSNHQPPQPPYNVGYMPSSSMDNYMNMPSSSSSSGPRAGRPGPGFAMGLGAGALAAGAVIFGDDFVSGFDLPTGFTISTDPPF